MKANSFEAQEFYSLLVKELFDAVMEISEDGITAYVYTCRFDTALEGREIPVEQLRRLMHRSIVADTHGITALTSEALRAYIHSGTGVRQSYCFSVNASNGIIGHFCLRLVPSGRKTLIAVLEKRTASGEVLTLMQNKTAVNIRISDIYYADYENHSVIIHTKSDRKRFFSVTFPAVAEILTDFGGFLRSYKNCMVNLDKVKCISEDCFIMANNDTIAIPKRRAREIKGAYAEYLSVRKSHRA